MYRCKDMLQMTDKLKAKLKRRQVPFELWFYPKDCLEKGDMEALKYENITADIGTKGAFNLYLDFEGSVYLGVSRDYYGTLKLGRSYFIKDLLEDVKVFNHLVKHVKMLEEE